MKLQELMDGLASLGFTSGYAAEGDPAEIILWENTEPQPSESKILAASADGLNAREREEIRQTRQQAYTKTADPMFFSFQRGTTTKQEWLDAVQAVVDANPYPEVN